MSKNVEHLFVCVFFLHKFWIFFCVFIGHLYFII
jgi:hypothetical protein